MMKKVIYKLVFFISVPIFLTLILYILLSSSTINGSYLAKLYQIKKSRLEYFQHQKKIIIIGGSNGKFCYYSPIIKKYFPDYEVVNASLQGNVGLMHSLSYIKPYLNKNDILILSPEYAMLQTESGLYGNYQSVHLMSVYNGIWKQNCSDYHHLKSFLAQSFMHYRALLEIFVIKYFMSKNGGVENFIKKHHNEYGDIIHAKGKIHYVSFPIQIDTHFNQQAVCFLNKYQKYCTENNINLFINFPAVAKQSLVRQLPDSIFLTNFKRNFEKIKYLNFPSDAVKDKIHFFDSPYHLREKEQHEHTLELCTNLSKHLN